MEAEFRGQEHRIQRSGARSTENRVQRSRVWNEDFKSQEYRMQNSRVQNRVQRSQMLTCFSILGIKKLLLPAQDQSAVI